MRVSVQAIVSFQSTPPRGGRRGACGNRQHRCTVSIHAPAGGATVYAKTDYDIPVVSIHAPAGGATFKCFADRHYRNGVSIHAPAGGATPIVCTWMSGFSAFQSTPPRGGRRRGLCDLGRLVRFQSTPPRGGRPASVATGERRNSFNPRPRGGGDSIADRSGQSIRRFNPRPRGGGD